MKIIIYFLNGHTIKFNTNNNINIIDEITTKIKENVGNNILYKLEKVSSNEYQVYIKGNIYSKFKKCIIKNKLIDNNNIIYEYIEIPWFYELFYSIIEKIKKISQIIYNYNSEKIKRISQIIYNYNSEKIKRIS